MDTFILMAINGLAQMWAPLDAAGVWLSSNDQTLIEATVILCILAFALITKERREGILMAASAFMNGIIMFYWTSATGFFQFFDRARPSLVLSSVHLLGKIPMAQQYASFPSAHAMFFFSLAGAVFFFDRRFGAVAAGVATLLSLSKLFIGVHWPSDILIGAMLGALVGWGISFVLNEAASKLFIHQHE